MCCSPFFSFFLPTDEDDATTSPPYTCAALVGRSCPYAAIWSSAHEILSLLSQVGGQYHCITIISSLMASKGILEGTSFWEQLVFPRGVERGPTVKKLLILNHAHQGILINGSFHWSTRIDSQISLQHRNCNIHTVTALAWLPQVFQYLFTFLALYFQYVTVWNILVIIRWRQQT